MITDELTKLIEIRNYVASAVENPRINRSTVNELLNILVLLEKKIFTSLTSEEFKTYIDYQSAKKTMEAVINITNIKSSFNK